jgi:hypothetical protein
MEGLSKQNGVESMDYVLIFLLGLVPTLLHSLCVLRAISVKADWRIIAVSAVVCLFNVMMRFGLKIPATYGPIIMLINFLIMAVMIALLYSVAFKYVMIGSVFIMLILMIGVVFVIHPILSFLKHDFEQSLTIPIWRYFLLSMLESNMLIIYLLLSQRIDLSIVKARD